MTDGLAVNLHVSNPSQTPLYFRCDVALFDQQNQLVGCTSWQALSPLGPGAKDRQFALTTADVPAARVEEVTAFKAVVYESDQLTGVEPVDAIAGARLPGEKVPAIVALERTKTERIDADSYVRHRALAASSFRDVTPENSDGRLMFGPDEIFELRLSPRMYDDDISHGSGPKRRVQKIRRWRFDSQLTFAEQTKPPQGSLFFVLLDAEGNLVTSGMSRLRLDFGVSGGVPKDRLFSATTVEAVAYTR
jgi:hypothetical protein